MGKISPEKLEAMRSINVLGALPSKPRVREYRTESGRVKATTDELGNTVTQRPGDRQDVHIQAQTVSLKATPKKIGE